MKMIIRENNSADKNHLFTIFSSCVFRRVFLKIRKLILFILKQKMGFVAAGRCIRSLRLSLNGRSAHIKMIIQSAQINLLRLSAHFIMAELLRKKQKETAYSCIMADDLL